MHKTPMALVRRSPRTAGAQHAEKLSDLGARIARVAHELNVPLSLIVGSLQSLEQYVDASVRYLGETEAYRRQNPDLQRLYCDLELGYLGEHATALLEICREGTRRFGHVIHQLREHTRDIAAVGPTARVDVKQIVENAISLASAGREVIPAVSCDFPELPPAPGIAESLSQAFVNLLANAFDAVATVEDPQVWITARMGGDETQMANVGRVASVLRSKGLPSMHPCLRIAVRDNGPGVPLAWHARIFEPFFTMKSGRSGMGLGLAITREIVEQHNGTVELVHGGGRGAQFVVTLPAADPDPGAPTGL